ncbi:response regulator [Sphingomicrobium lutaoense]|uniref:CheY-like chemotaxis protein n=1 Tax=Sphingomicrobium lutaoense TaxID=515949 RepID=A0A839YXF4_9SPHN|nr:response regulator [Sphingomicrobium lutaoense]MBB3762998.1 CheY-like chemotaxis protein [Sphingomicrobium lutaoense]
MPDDKRQKILVVEDEYLIALDITHTLEDAGFLVVGPHETVADSLEQLAEGMPDCAILDVQLDGEDIELVAVALTNNQVPIIFHSGHAKPSDLEQRFPGSYFCGKPCTPSHLIQTLRTAVSR